jgi:hypothetical protein
MGTGAISTEQKEGKLMVKPDIPFPRHWLYFIAIKLVVIALAVLAALSYLGYV